MYVRTLENPGLGFLPELWPGPLPLSIRRFTSSVIKYKDNDADDKARPTMCSVFVPTALVGNKVIDLLVFFHGHDSCRPKHDFDPARMVDNFRLGMQVESASPKRKVALAVPSVFWRYDDHRNGSDLKNIRVAWSAAYLNAFVEEVLDQIGQWSRVRPNLGGLILAGHSRAYDILTPLSDQVALGVRETTMGALRHLREVLAMDTTYGLQHAKALEKWAHHRGDVQFRLVLGNSVKWDEPPAIWQRWMDTRGKEKFPTNLKVFKTKDDHCALPGKYVKSFLEDRLPVK